MQIPEMRQKQTYLDGAYWCSTVMSMLDFDGSVKYVWNPFSLYELKSMLGDFDAYLVCVATHNDASCVAPKHNIFEEQQISLLAVYQRCLTNYQEMTWDQGTYVLFNETVQDLTFLQNKMPMAIEDTFGVADCLLKQRKYGYDNVGCLTDYFLKGQQAMDFFEYGNITVQNPSSNIIDACLTFSGPAQIPDPAISAPFKACLEGYANRSGCDIPHMLWSGRSTNKVPVATQHAMKITDSRERQLWATNMMQNEKAKVLAAIESLKNWNGSNLRISVFSAEGRITLLLSSFDCTSLTPLPSTGDLLHQFADCAMMVRQNNHTDTSPLHPPHV